MLYFKPLHKIALVAYVFLSLSACGSNEVDYDNRHNLEQLISAQLSYDLTSEKKTVLIILKNEECICTEQDVALAKDLLTSQKYSQHKFIFILSSKKHKFLSRIPKNTADQVAIVYDNDEILMANGYIATTDRVIIYENGSSTYFADMHITKPEQIRKQLL